MPFAKWQAGRVGNFYDVNSSTYQAREGDPVMYQCQFWIGVLLSDPSGSSLAIQRR